MKICENCKNEFKNQRVDQKYCSTQCRRVVKNINRKKEPIKFNCVVCGVMFMQKRKDNVTCSDTCSQRLWVKNNPEKNKLRQQNRTPYNKSNPGGFKVIQRRYKNKRMLTDVTYKMYHSISVLIRSSFKNVGNNKSRKTQQILGCTFEEFKEHLEKQFEPWMNWDNYGKYNGELNFGWDIDHIEPLFPLGITRSEEDIVRLNHYTNLRPLCSKVNRVLKRNKKYFGY